MNAQPDNILVVDDTPDNLRLLSAMLTERGYKVRQALNGQMALTTVRRIPPDLILLDINMPQMNGYEVCTRLKADEQTCEIPVIFISALDDVLDKVNAFKVGGADYITKPFQSEEVLARIQNQLNLRRLQKQLQEQNAQMRQMAKREKLLSQISQRIRQSLNLKEILMTAVTEVRQLLQTDRVVICQLKTDGSIAIVQESVASKELSILNAHIYDPCFSETYIQEYRQGRIQAVEDIYTAGLRQCYVDFLAQLQVRSNLVVPILQSSVELGIMSKELKENSYRSELHSQLYGLLVVHHCSSIRQWQESEIELLQQLSTQIGIALQQGQLYHQLRLAEQRYHSIVENAVDGIFQTTPSGCFLSANSALARIYGYDSPEDLISSVNDIGQQLYVDPNRRQEFIAILQADNAVYGFESQVYRQDGSTIWTSENARGVRDSNGMLLYCEGIVSDITERKLTQEALHLQQEQTEKLLLNILPNTIAQRLKQEQGIIADSFEEVSVLFADIVGFTTFSAQVPPIELVNLLNQIFSKFDRLADRHGLEKIKTIGDAYMVVGGLPLPLDDHAGAIAEMALEMQQAIAHFQTESGQSFQIRIGIHTGPVVAGVIGTRKFIYDLWGDTVNVASRMESTGVPGCIQVSATTYEYLKERYKFEERGKIEVKGKGKMMTYLLVSREI